MPYETAAIANYILDRTWPTKQAISPMKLQKLVYFSHGWHLAIVGLPLINEFVEAWQFGPVVPSLYHEFKEFGNTSITRRAKAMTFDGSRVSFTEPVLPATPDVERSRDIMDRVLTQYAPLSAIRLSDITHEPNSPWEQIRKKYPGVRGADIPNDLIESHFRALATPAKKG